MAFVLGAMTGAAFALIWAPAAGEETRRYLGDRAREGADRAGDAARQMGERVREGSSRAGEAMQQGKDYIERGRASIATAVEQGREAYRSAREEEEEQA